MRVFYLFYNILVLLILPWMSKADSSLSYHFPDEDEKNLFIYDDFKKHFYDRHHSIYLKLENCYVIYPENRIQCTISADNDSYNGYKSLSIVSEKDPYKCIQLSDSNFANITLSDVKLWAIIRDDDDRWFYQRRVYQMYDLSDDTLGGDYNKKRFEFTFKTGDTQLCQYSIEYDKSNIEFLK